MEEKVELMFWRAAVAAGFILLVAIIVGIGSCTRNDYNRQAACDAVGGRLVRIEGNSSNNWKGCSKVNATYEMVDSVRAYR